MDQFFNREFVQRSYATQDNLAARILSHQRYSLQTENIFDTMTRFALTLSVPEKILDIGAGTGAWYSRIRRYVGPDSFYQAVDQSPAMVTEIEKVLGHDSKASVCMESAETLNAVPESFDWVGLHFMLYHVVDIRGVLSKAWELVHPSGVLLAATNGSNSYAEMKVFHQQIIRKLGLPYQDNAGIDRFSLAIGSQFFSLPVHKVEVPAGLQFPDIDSYLSYYGSGFCWAGIPVEYHTPTVQEQLMQRMKELVRPHFQQDHYLKLSNTTGYFWVQKQQND